jgi:hypothetical protein
MKKILLLALAAFALVACNKDNDGPKVDMRFFPVEVTGGQVNVAELGDAAEIVNGKLMVRVGTVVNITPDVVPNQHIPSEGNDPSKKAGWEVVQGGPLKVRANKFIMPAASVSLKAVFVENTYFVVTSECEVISAERDGVPIEMEDGSIPAGAKVVVKVVAAPDGYKFDGDWVITPGGLDYVEGDDAAGGTRVFVMPASDVNMRAAFVPRGLVITLEGATARAMIGGQWVDYNQDLWLTANVTQIELIPDAVPAGEVFAGWTVENDPTVENTTPVTIDSEYKFTMPGWSVKVTAGFKLKPVHNDPCLLYWDGTNLALGGWRSGEVGSGSLLYVKFGSVIAFNTGWDNDKWLNGGHVKFNPTDIPTADFDAENGYDGIPYMQPVVDPSNVVDDYITSRHSSYSVTQGLGDICRLVGLSPAEAAFMARKGTLESYNSGYRTPTPAEMLALYPAADMHITHINQVPGGTTDDTDATFLPTRGIRYAPVGDPRTGQSTYGVARGGVYRTTATAQVAVPNEGGTGSTDYIVGKYYYFGAQYSGGPFGWSAPTIMTLAAGEPGAGVPVRCVPNN